MDILISLMCLKVCGETNGGLRWHGWEGIRRLHAAFFISMCLFLCTVNLRGTFVDTATDLEVLLHLVVFLPEFSLQS